MPHYVVTGHSQERAGVSYYGMRKVVLTVVDELVGSRRPRPETPNSILATKIVKN